MHWLRIDKAGIVWFSGQLVAQPWPVQSTHREIDIVTRPQGNVDVSRWFPVEGPAAKDQGSLTAAKRNLNGKPVKELHAAPGGDVWKLRQP